MDGCKAQQWFTDCARRTLIYGWWWWGGGGVLRQSQLLSYWQSVKTTELDILTLNSVAFTRNYFESACYARLTLNVQMNVGYIVL